MGTSGAITVDGVVRRFGAVTALDGVSLNIESGETVGLLGHNGAGKTTLIRLINGLLRPHAGAVKVFGRDPSTDGTAVRRRTGVVIASPALDGLLTPLENLALHGALRGLSPDETRRRAWRWLDELDMADRAETPCGDLSLGLQQRVALARALLHDPDILLLDEPTANLDPVAAARVLEVLRRLDRDRPRGVLLCTHNLVEAQEMCSRVIVLHEGHVLAAGTPGELAGGAGAARTLIEVGPGTAAAARAAVPEALPRVRGNSLLDVDGRVPVPEVVRRLVRAGIEVHRVEPARISLPDIYRRLHDPETG